jgi:kynurenine formamidase
VDYYSYAQEHGIKYDPMSAHKISLSELLAAAKEQGVKPQYGDILITRTGFIAAYNALDRAGREKLVSGPWSEHSYVGIEQSEEVLDWLHDNYFAAVAGDQPSFETWPFPELAMHPYLLPRWGLPIGEMWDTERLAEMCKKHSRNSFFFVSSPANVKGKPHEQCLFCFPC